MAEAAVGATIQVLLENLLTLSKEQIGLVRNFKNDLEKLKQTISMVNDFLHDAEKRQVADRAVKRWMRDLEALAFEADNVFDEFNYHLLSKKVGPTTVKKKVQSLFPFSYRLKLGRSIKDINEKFESINQTASKLGLQNIAAQAPVYAASTSRQTDSFSKDSIFLGREDDMSSIVDTLITAEQKLSVLPIVGMGGQGKTTLARKVFNHEQIESHFGDNRVWVHVPRIFDDVVLLKRILTSIKAENDVEHGNREALLKTLKKELGAKKYLLLLDDVWNEDKEKWDDFEKSLLGISSATGNCMIVTTRSESVASFVGALRVHQLKGLSKDDCWSIIKAKAFREGDNYPLEFEDTGKNVAEKCGGSPLAASVVGGLLVGKSKDDWMSIEKDWLADFGNENPITKILKLSFDNLPLPSVKKCFAYCSIFPKGYRIEKEQLVELWMAEGFIQTLDGNIILNILLQNSLLQVSGRDNNGNVTDCNMHDLVHDLAYSVLYENDNVTNGVFQRRYIGYKPSGDGLLSIPEGQERFVRTLFFNGKISDIKFSNFESLRTFNFVGIEDTEELPTSITKLKHLRYLDISKTSIKYLPNSIGELYHLQTLGVCDELLEKWPDSMSCLISLRHLHISSGTYFKIALPRGIGNLTSLQTLPYFSVGGEKGIRISELGNLKDLKGKLEIHNLENVRHKNEAISADLLGKPGIYELTLLWEGYKEGDEANDESVLEGLRPHPNLKRLQICGFKGKSLSLWEGLNNLVEIKLEECNECEELPMLGHLTHLKSLYLHGWTNVKSIRSSFFGNIDNCRRDTIVVVFPMLERLELCDMPNLKEWEWDEVMVLPRLKYLNISECKQLTSAPSQFPCLEELEIEDIKSSLPLENICGIKLTSLTRLKIKGIKGLECLPEWLFSSNHNLTELEIFDCPRMTHLVPHLRSNGAPSLLLRTLTIYNCRSLRELPDDLHKLNPLEKLSIARCPNLKSIRSGGGQQQGFTSLRDLDICDCEGLNNLPIEMICAPSLEKLELTGLSSITNFPFVIGCLHKMTSLIDLIICEVPKISIVNTLNGSLSCNNLRYLRMDPFSSDTSWDNVSLNETVGAMLQQCISLRHLVLTGMEHWECLPDQLQHLTSLEALDLRDFGIETLPEWFGNLESLEVLRLIDCKKLRRMPSKQAMQRLSKLIGLDILYCPLLLKEKRSNNVDDEIVDSEWPKISHIPRIYMR
ncbi:hypothetical protein CASFOL_012439 [Castilleja foliolosa]|uniref:Disease resistance protein RGA3 n=1 Tax=Castilleja foliolosa TaxID=1961234 RepID=A0ABD3DIF1_9LAMI